MPMVIPLLVYAGATYLGATALVATIAATIASTAVNQHQARRARQKARDAWNASLQDRLVSISAVDAARSRVYGRVRCADGILFKGSYGANKERLVIVMACAGHEVDDIEQVYFDDKPVTLQTGVMGWQAVMSAPYLYSGSTSMSQIVTVTGGTGTATVPSNIIPGTATATITAGTLNGDLDASSATVSITGSIATISAALVDGGYTLAYQISSPASYARVYRFTGIPGQDLSTVLAPLFPGTITSAHKFQGIAGVIVEFFFNPDVYPNGVPQVSAVVRGAKVRDLMVDGAPPPSSYRWSRNPAEIAYDWAVWSNGGRLSPVDVDFLSFRTAAAVCDILTNFALPSGVVVAPRFTCDIAIRTDADPSAAFASIVESMAGKHGWAGGLLRVRAGSYVPPVASIDENWIRGAEPRTEGEIFQVQDGSASIQIVPAPARTELVNVIRPTIADQNQNYVSTPIQEIRSSTYIAADGGEYVREVEYAGIGDAYHASLVAQINMREARNGLTCILPCNMRAYQLELFDVVKVNLPRYGWNDKTFEVIGWKWVFGSGITLTLKETTAAIFDPAEDLFETDLTPNTALPDPFDVPVPTGVTIQSGTNQLLKQKDGTIVSRMLVSWTLVPSAAVQEGGFVEIRHGQADKPESLWASELVPGNTTSVYISPVQDGVYYIVKLRSLSSRRIRGFWSQHYLHKVLGKTQPPANVTGFTAAAVVGGVDIAWDPNTEIDYLETEVRNGASWPTAVPIFKGKANRTKWTPATAGAYTLMARHRDTSRNESSTSALTTVTVTSANLTGGVSNTNIIDASEWIPGTSGTQGTSPRRFVQNGSTVENTIELLNGPDGALRPVWRGVSQDASTGGTTDGDGGWDSDPFEVKVSKQYRFSVWVKCLGAMDGSAYLGTGSTKVLSISGQGDPNNPYFVVQARSGLVSGRWYLLVGYVLPNSYAGTQQNMGGVFDGVTGKKIANGIDYKWAAGSSGVLNTIHRAYQFYGSVGAEQQFWGPRVDLCDGLEPTIDDLLAVSLSGRVVAAEDVVLVARGTCEAYGGRFGKPRGADAWDSDVYSRDGYTGGAFVSFVPEQTNKALMVGLNSDPTTNQSYDTLDWAMYCGNDGNIYAYQSNVNAQSFGAYGTGDVLSVVYDGSTVRWLKNGVVLRAVATTPGQVLYMDTSLHGVGGYVRSVKFGPMTANNWASVGGRPKQFRVVARGANDTSAPVGHGLYDADTGALIGGAGGRSYNFARIRRSDGAVVAGPTVYDVYGDNGTTGATEALVAALNATDANHIAVVWTYDEPQNWRLQEGLPAAMYRCGASPAVFGSPQFQYRSAYILIGIGGIGQGQGFEAYNGDTAASSNAWCDVSFLITGQGQLIISGMTATPRTLADYSYTGDLNATYGAQFGVNIIGQAQTGDIAPFAATDIYSDVTNMNGTGFGSAVVRSITITPEVNSVIELTASASADNVLSDSGSILRWTIQPTGGTEVIIAAAGSGTTARQQFTGVGSYAANGGVELTVRFRTVAAFGSPSIHVWDTGMRATIVKR